MSKKFILITYLMIASMLVGCAPPKDQPADTNEKDHAKEVKKDEKEIDLKIGSVEDDKKEN